VGELGEMERYIRDSIKIFGSDPFISKCPLYFKQQKVVKL